MCSVPTRALGFNRVMTLNKLCTYSCVLANQTNYPLGVGKLYRQFLRDSTVVRNVRDGEVVAGYYSEQVFHTCICMAPVKLKVPTRHKYRSLFTVIRLLVSD